MGILVFILTLYMGTGERVVALARQFEGHIETAHNRSPLIDHWNQRLGVPLGSNYCGTFVAYILDEANVKKPTVRSGVARHYRTSESIDARHVASGRAVAREGYIVVWGRTGCWTGHVDFVSEWWVGRRGMAIGANVSPPGEESGGRGIGVFEKERTINPHAYFRIEYFTPVN